MATERLWLELNLYELDAMVRSVGRQTVLHCGDCNRSVGFQDAVPGPVRDWPYCPTHPDKALTIRAATITKSPHSLRQ